METDIYTLYEEMIGPRTLSIKYNPSLYDQASDRFYPYWVAWDCPNGDRDTLDVITTWWSRMRAFTVVVKILNSGQYSGIEPTILIENILCLPPT